MPETLDGALFYDEGNTKQPFFLERERRGRKAGVVRQALDEGLIGLDARAAVKASPSGLAVKYDIQSGKVLAVRLPGKAAHPPVPPEPGAFRADPVAVQARADVRRDFHNPYNFVPAPPRSGIQGPLGDQNGELERAHDHLSDANWTGRIAVTLKTKTPLLIPDGARHEDQDGHKIYPLRRDPVDPDKPYLAPTAIKGALRSAYEAVTNSRMGVFFAHDGRLAQRQDTREGLKMVPARVERQAGRLTIHLLPGTTGIGARGAAAPREPMYAAWLPCYEANRPESPDPRRPRYPGGLDPEHGDPVDVYLEAWEKTRHDGHSKIFSYWKVRAVAPRGTPLGSGANHQGGRNHRRARDGASCTVSGYVYRNKHNFDKKHDERVFFVSPDHPQQAMLAITHNEDESQKLESAWRDLIANYQEIHEDERDNGALRPSALRHAVWSRHVTEDRKGQQLEDGDLCYASVCQDGARFVVNGLYPVLIGRELFEIAPADLLPKGLEPPDDISELSPADRVFGWIRQEKRELRRERRDTGRGGYRGRLRIGPVRWEDGVRIEDFTQKGGVPLAILGQPKPQQARFYLARNKQGHALSDGLDKQRASYNRDKGLRGRKVYPHHRDRPASYWESPWEDRTKREQGGLYQEYRRPDHYDRRKGRSTERDDQNRTVNAWVGIDSRATFDLFVEDLAPIELGALLWLLSLGGDCFHRLGGGKPLGFGSVHLAIDWDGTQLATGEGWRRNFLSLEDEAFATRGEIEPQEDVFKQATVGAYGSAFDQVPFIAAFLAGSRGFSGPIHYPRAHPPHQPKERCPQPAGENFKWFGENERRDKVALMDLAGDQGLPLYEEHERERG